MQSYMENPSTQTHFDVSKQIEQVIMEETYLNNLKKILRILLKLMKVS